METDINGNEMLDTVESDVGNSYGVAMVWRTNDGVYMFGVSDNEYSTRGNPVSDRFYAEFVSLFGGD